MNRPDSKDSDISTIRDIVVDSLFSVFVTAGWLLVYHMEHHYIFIYVFGKYVFGMIDRHSTNYSLSPWQHG